MTCCWPTFDAFCPLFRFCSKCWRWCKIKWFFCKKALPQSSQMCERKVQLPSGWRLLCSMSPCLATKLLPQCWQKCVLAFWEVTCTTWWIGCSDVVTMGWIWTACWGTGCCLIWTCWTVCWFACWICWAVVVWGCWWIWICWCCWFPEWPGLCSSWLTTSPDDVIIWTGTGDDELPCVVINVVPFGKLTKIR